jgi:hypothetical protein
MTSTVSIEKAAIPYDERVAMLLANYLRPKTKSVATLAAALGCRHMVRNASGWRIPEHKPNSINHEQIVLQALLSALHWHVRNKDRAPEDGLLLLDGILRNERWKTCLSTMTSAHDFAMLLIRQTSKLRDTKHGVHVHPLMSPVRTMLNGWLCLDPKTYTYIPPARPLAEALFGSAWCDLMLPGAISERTPQVIEELIDSTRPSFLPGLCKAQDSVPDMVLPALTMTL